MPESFDEWCVLELMGHRKLAGRVTEATLAGGTFIRIDIVTTGHGPETTQYYAPGAVYCITPTTEELARAFALQNIPQPVARWELPKLEQKHDNLTVEPPTPFDDDDGVHDDQEPDT